ncbi:MAG TPA: alanine racemase [Solirubrobacteraceae bacterium]|nr:alanine racemase [Solirubrobacteraceae bacterium]
MALRAHARVNLAAVQRNVEHLRAGLTRGTEFCAVVKANASGHGAIPVARAALAGGAGRLAVATAGEAAELRAAGIQAPVLVMGALSRQEMAVALQARAEVVAWSPGFVDAVAAVAWEPVGIHVKYDTGMGRLGTRDRDAALAVADHVLGAGPGVRLTGAMTHFATADGDRAFLDDQLAAFAPFAEAMRGRRPGITIHSANSAATVREPASHGDMVRCGIAIYGADPMNVAPEAHGLEPALALTSYVAVVKRARPGDSAGYGRRFVAERETWLATVPIGYADGIRRALSGRFDVLIAGHRRRAVGTVSMDNLTVELGPVPPADIGPETPVTLIGRDGDERITAEELSNAMGSIAHELFCGLSTRVTRTYHRDGEPVR